MNKGSSYIMESIIYYDSAILIIKYNLQTSAVFSNLYLLVLNTKLKCGSCFHAKCLIQSSRITLQLWYYFQWVILFHIIYTKFLYSMLNWKRFCYDDKHKDILGIFEWEIVRYSKQFFAWIMKLCLSYNAICVGGKSHLSKYFLFLDIFSFRMQLSSKLEFNEYLFCGLSKLVVVFMINVCSSIPSVATSICQIHNVLPRHINYVTNAKGKP